MRYALLFFDGLCEPVNPGGVATYGYAIYVDGRRIAADCGVVGSGMEGRDVTNNVAEYSALIAGLRRLLELGWREGVEIRGDSQLVIRQLQGVYAVRSPRIAPLYEEAKRLLSEFADVRLVWIPRELNREADELSRKCYREYCLSRYEEFRRFYARWLATPKQLALLRRLGVEPDPLLSKREATRLIEKLLSERRR